MKYFHQLISLPRQLKNCPASVQQIENLFDSETGLIVDEYLKADWNPDPKARHCMRNVTLRIKDVDTKTVSIPGGALKTVTNVTATNGMFDVQITAWEKYGDLLANLEIGEVKNFRPSDY
jgi:hypothetical protein